MRCGSICSMVSRRLATLGGTAPLIATLFVDAVHPTWVAIYMIVIVALCLIVYFTLPETGSRTRRATVALNDLEVLEGEKVEVSSGVWGASQTKHSP